VLFNSIVFAVFFPVVFALYWAIPSDRSKVKASFLVLASYFFYGWWDARFLILILFSTLVDYYVALGIQHSEDVKRKKALLYASLTINLGLLAGFKYLGFITEIANDLIGLTNASSQLPIFDVLLPVGISFYTFQTLSYTIDVYRGSRHATRNLIEFAGYVSFFPQLVAGPIERSKVFLPQFSKKKVFIYSQAVEGVELVIWGLFKKMVVADNCAKIVNRFYDSAEYQSGSTMALVTILFAFQIYGDFSGYTDIARGLAKLLGFELSLNFRFPYFAKSITDFWKRWHISLTNWFRDYLYIPLGGNRQGKTRIYLNILIVFLVSGLWHGANWTFVLWGAFHAFLFIPYHLIQRTGRIKLSDEVRILDLPMIGITFLLVCIGWVFFRANNAEQAWIILSEVFSSSLFSIPSVRPYNVFLFIGIMLCLEWVGRSDHFPLNKSFNLLPRLAKWFSYSILIIMIVFFSAGQQSFIYFQF